MSGTRIYQRPYIASPYSVGDRDENARASVAAADKLLTLHYHPFCPLLTHHWEAEFSHEYETWMRYDLAWLAQCDCLIRLPGISPGADREVAFAQNIGLPVYMGLDAFLEAEGLTA